MITGLTEEQFMNLPGTSLHYPCDKCGKQHDYGSLMRDIGDYSLRDGEIISKSLHTALYLCGACHWQMTCEYRRLDRALMKEQSALKSNEAKWLRKVSRLTVQELADKLGVSRQAYHKWLRGKPISEGHKAHLKELITSYIQEDKEEDEPYLAGGVMFVKRIDK